MEKIWLKSYPEGIPAEIGPLAESSLGELMDKACRRHADQTAYLSMGIGLSYAELGAVGCGWRTSAPRPAATMS